MPTLLLRLFSRLIADPLLDMKEGVTGIADDETKLKDKAKDMVGHLNDYIYMDRLVLTCCR